MTECVACAARQGRKAAEPKQHSKLNPLCPVHQRPKSWPIGSAPIQSARDWEPWMRRRGGAAK